MKIKTGVAMGMMAVHEQAGKIHSGMGYVGLAQADVQVPKLALGTCPLVIQ